MSRSLVTSRRQTVARVFPNIQSRRVLAFARPQSGVLNPVAPELLANAGFDTNTVGWSGSAATLAWVAGGTCLVTVTTAGTSNVQLLQPLDLTPFQGQQVRARVRMRNVSISGGILMSVIDATTFATLGVTSLVVGTAFEDLFFDFVVSTANPCRWRVYNPAAAAIGEAFEVDFGSLKQDLVI